MKYGEIDIEKGSKFLVTGGAGFIGSNIVEALLEEGFKTRVLDNFSTGSRANIQDFLGNSLFEIMEGDIRDAGMCRRACEGMDYILHQGALGSVPRSVSDPVTTNDVNIGGTLNMLVAARDCGVKVFVYASSSSVYGDEQQLPKVEHRVGKPLSPYATTKRVNEFYARNFYDLYGLKTIGLRYFNVFGRRQDAHSVYAAVIPIFVMNLIKGTPPVINGDGEQSRDFTHIDNVIQANLRACTAGSRAWGEVFNIACGSRATINQLYDRLRTLTGKDLEPVYGPERPGDVKHSNADISKARDILGYRPGVDMDAGLEKAIGWYVQNLTT